MSSPLDLQGTQPALASTLGSPRRPRQRQTPEQGHGAPGSQDQPSARGGLPILKIHQSTRGYTESVTSSPQGRRQADPEFPLTSPPSPRRVRERGAEQETPLDHDIRHNGDSQQIALARGRQRWHPTTLVQFRSHPPWGEERSDTFAKGQAC